MTTNINQQGHDVKDLSGGIQRKTTKFLVKPNQVDLAINASFQRIGGVEKIAGYDRLGNTITTSSTSTSTSTTTTSTSTSTSSSTSTSTSTSSTTTA